MARNIVIVLFALIGLALAGCATNLGVYDSSVPHEQLCTLKIDSNLFVRQFDGNKVQWNQSFPQLGVVVQIPAGQHSFVVDYDGSTSRYTRWAAGIRCSDTFEAGKTYVMTPIVSSDRVSIDVKTE